MMQVSLLPDLWLTRNHQLSVNHFFANRFGIRRCCASCPWAILAVFGADVRLSRLRRLLREASTLAKDKLKLERNGSEDRTLLPVHQRPEASHSSCWKRRNCNFALRPWLP
ncbi:hypothetical protein GUJ93_ZPchr0003g16947 [Zizania palustris]|uniref:Uncharacterized protein n=1 Tax=Zizania palustris TaxID=103762 RepID=A0A8J5V5S0_ZIZPA|nr:hypothetical protein GUJ93_ZPchr0003g16947 [Zizania palustris]